MRRLRHGTSGDSWDTEKHRHAPRDAWYPDPFGVGDERWWDGNQWSGEERASTSSEAAGRPSERPPRVEPKDPPQRASVRSIGSASAGADDPFPVSIESVVEERLSVVSSPRKPGLHCQVLAPRGRAGSISLFGGQMARLACAEGTWFLKRSPTESRGLRIESTDRRQAGRYLPRRSLPGGSIRLSDGTEVELRRSRPGRWKVQSSDGRTCLAEVRRSRRRSARGQELIVSVHSLPTDATNASLIILAACALLIRPASID